MNTLVSFKRALNPLAGQFSANVHSQAARGAEALVPAILGGFKKQAQAQPMGLEGLGGLLGQLGGGSLLDQVLAPQPTEVSSGNEVLGQIFGSKDVSRAVAQNAALLAHMANAVDASRAKVTGTGTSIQAARETLAWAQRDLQRLQQLGDQQLVSRKMVDDARHAVAEARTDLADAIAAQSEAAASLSGKASTPTEDLPDYRAALAMLAKARLDLAHAEVRAPVDGVIGTHDLQVGEFLNVGQTAMPLVAADPVWIEANFKETELAKMQVGQAATIEVDSYPGVKWKAHVASIAPASGAEFSVLPAQNATGNWVKIVQRIPVRLELDGADRDDPPVLRAGMSAEVKVDLRDAPAADAVTAVAAGQH